MEGVLRRDLERFEETGPPARRQLCVQSSRGQRAWKHAVGWGGRGRSYETAREQMYLDDSQTPGCMKLAWGVLESAGSLAPEYLGQRTQESRSNAGGLKTTLSHLV